MADRRVQLGADVRSDHLAHGSSADEKVNLETCRCRADDSEVLHLVANKGPDDRHRVIHGAKSTDDDDVAVSDKASGFILSGQHLSALRTISASDRVKLHSSVSRMFVAGRTS